MLKAIIDATCYPVVCIKAKERPVVPSMALRVLEFDPCAYHSDFLLYFQEMEE